MKTTKIFCLLAASIILFPTETKAESYDLYVDKSSTQNTETGTESYPYKTITQALTAAANNDTGNRKIMVKKGEYTEVDIILIEGVKMYGDGQSDTIINGSDSSENYTLKMEKNTELHDLTIKNGNYGILVDEYSKALIKNCKITDAKKAGIRVLMADVKDSQKFTLEDSTIEDNDDKGVEIDKRKIDISDNEILDNGEEGIDLRSRITGSIAGNTIKSSGEGGIEIELKKVDLSIKNNKISTSKASGLNFQYRKRYDSYKNEVDVTKNTLKNNHHYGIRCSRPTGGNYSPNFFNQSINLSDNTLQGNNYSNFSPECRFK